ncbi:membrane protein [Arthrobacter cryoconiti]
MCGAYHASVPISEHRVSGGSPELPSQSPQNLIMPDQISPEPPELTLCGSSTVPASLARVPEVTVLFWIIKVLTTGMGETTSDFLAHTLDPVLAVGIGGVCFVAALVLQFSRKRYIPWVYWLAVVMVSVFGTMAADVLHVGLGIPYAVSSVFYAVVLTLVFLAWKRVEGTLSIHSVYTRRREAFYWAAVLATFALGTAVGDLTAVTLHWGYLGSGILFATAIAIPALAHWKLGLNPILAFWAAYILTRPLGASFADWMGVSHARGGLGWGTGLVSIGWSMAIVALVAILATRKPRQVSLSTANFMP